MPSARRFILDVMGIGFGGMAAVILLHMSPETVNAPGLFGAAIFAALSGLCFIYGGEV